MVVHCFGPIEGRRHDAFMLGESGLYPLLERFNKANGEPLCIYGDPAYPLRARICSPFRGARVSPEEEQFNRSMSSVRQAVEWNFGKVATYFAFLDFEKNLKLLLQPIAKYYFVGVLLCNCHTCFYGSVTSSYFDVNPPSITSYLRNVQQ